MLSNLHRGILLLLLIGASSCAPHAVGRTEFLTDRWSVVHDSGNDYVVVAKGQTDLNEALEMMGCKKKPCSVGRIGDVYAVTQVPTKHKK